MGVIMVSSGRRERIDALARTTREQEGGVSVALAAWRYLRCSPAFFAGVTILAIFLLLALFAPMLAPHDPADRLLEGQVSRAHNLIPSPQRGFLLGGDQYGRDLLSRLLLGSRQTLLLAVAATAIGVSGGIAIGVAAGAFGHWVDSAVMRVLDALLAVPSLLLALSIGVLFAQPSRVTVILVVGLVQVPVFGRLLRSAMRAQQSSDYVFAARALGVPETSIVFRHMLPNALTPVVVQGFLALATVIIDASALSFLGFAAVDDSVPEWSQILGSARDFFDLHPQLAVWPAGCIMLTALGFTLVGEALRNALDPRHRR